MEINVWLMLAFAVSGCLNVVLFWLSREQSFKLSIIADNSDDLIQMVVGFRDHLKAVYELESFYGDETLKALLDHANSLSVILSEQYGDIASLSEPLEYEESEEEINDTQENENEKHVFYAGTRRRDS